MLEKVPILTRGGTICLKYYELTLKTVWIIEESERMTTTLLKRELMLSENTLYVVLALNLVFFADGDIFYTAA